MHLIVFNFEQTEEILFIGEAIKKSGNHFYKKEEYQKARGKYKKALKYLNKLHEINNLSPDQDKRNVTLELNLLLNR